MPLLNLLKERRDGEYVSIISIAVSCAITSHLSVHDCWCWHHCWHCGQKLTGKLIAWISRDQESVPSAPVYGPNEHAVLQLFQYFPTQVVQIDSEWPISAILQLFQFFLLNPLSTRDLSKIASFISSLIGGPIKILP